jgi:methyltransferase-like protein 6
LYNEDRITLSALDIVEDEIPYNDANYAILMFVLSAIFPEKHEKVIQKIYSALAPGGILYFRDYAQFDLAQLRFAQRNKSKLSDNLYFRKDKTLAFYFNKCEIEELFKKNNFEVVESKVICRLIENRKENLKMHRLWLQIKLKKT